jgi:hypothetical protein
MRTLVYCTAYAASPAVWQTRYRPWLDAMLAVCGADDQILIVDDGSATLPGWDDTQVFSGDTLGEAFTVGPRGEMLLFHFRRRLGRLGMGDFPGWHRSYVFGALYAEANGFDRVIHVESDAFVISARARQFLWDYKDGWAALWCAQYDMPEMAISVAVGSGLRTLAGFARQPYDALIGTVHEKLMPYSHVERGLIGDRYGETSAPVPPDADYAAQVPSHRERGYYWWLPGHEKPTDPVHSLTLLFGEGGSAQSAVNGGWAEPEIDHHWMLGAESILRLPALAGEGPGVLRMGVRPCVVEDVLTRQRLMIEVNGRRVGEYDITLETVLGCDIPAAILRAQGTNLLRLVHPDAVAPAVLSPSLSDTRRLSLSLEWLTFERW